MTIHEMKSWSHFYDAVIKGLKTHELRSNLDRKFEVGDKINLRRFDHINGIYTGESCMVEITYITSNQYPCAFSSAILSKDYSILSIKLLNEDHQTTNS